MQVQLLVRNVTSKTQVLSSSGSSNDTYSWDSWGIDPNFAHRVGVEGDPITTLSVLCHPRTEEEEGSVAGEFDDIRRRLEAIGEELADLAIERLRESIDAGGTELPVDERRLTRARRAVEKAAGILAEPDDTF
jgi:hypothetical protein